MPQVTRVTSRDVAVRAGVSRTAVSLVLNGKDAGHVGHAARERVLRAAAELGYVPDAAGRHLVSGRTRALGVSVGGGPVLRNDPFAAEALAGVGDEARRRGFRVLIHGADDPGGAEGHAYAARARQVDGLIVLYPRRGDAQLLRLIDDGFPILVLGPFPERPRACVGAETSAGARQATRHLRAAGRRRIGHLALASDEVACAAARRAGYRAALAEGEAPQLPLERDGGFDAESGHRAMRALLAAAPALDAVLCGGDAIAWGALAALREAGRRVPDDVALVGFDDLPGGRYVQPRLSTVRTYPREQGRVAARRLLDTIEGAADPGEVALPPARLVVRRSCGTGPPSAPAVRARPHRPGGPSR